MPKQIKIFKYIPLHPSFQTPMDHKVDILNNTSLDAHAQRLSHMDKVVFSSSKGWYFYGYFLGTTESGKSAKVMYFSPTAIRDHQLEISSLGASNLLKINWDDSVCSGIQPNIQEVFAQLSLGLSTIEVR